MFFKKPIGNQTEFAGKAPILTEPNLAEIDPEIANKELVRKRLLKKIVLLGGLVLLVIASIMILLVISTPKKVKQQKKVTPTPTPTPELIDQSLFGRVQDIKSQLEQNDPAQDELFFPNVSEGIYLDLPRRK